MRKRMREAQAFVGTCLLIGVGSKAMEGMGTAVGGLAGLSKFAPAMGNIIGLKWVTEELSAFGKAVKKK